MITLYAILVLFGLALLFSVLLAYCGNKLAVPTDEKVEKVCSLLTGANCGGCGYAGCASFAEELCKGNAPLSACASTSKENKDAIAEILGIANDGVECKVVVRCCGGLSCNDKYDYQGYGDCRTSDMLSGGRKECEFGCQGMRTCCTVCNSGAVVVDSDKGYALIKQDKCIKCGLCVANCPKHLIVKIPASAKVFVACSSREKGKDVKSKCAHGCIGCGLCARVCPSGAITVKDNLAEIDYEKCTGCGLCAEKCPTKAIHTFD